MHFQILVEDISGEVFLNHIMEKLKSQYSNMTYNIKHFKGIGGFKFSGNANKVKTDKLLNDLIIFLRGFDKSFQNYSASIIVVLDNDQRNPEEFKKQLENQAEIANISTDYVFCIAIEEIEAWLLGDKEAIQKAYPNVRLSLLNKYVQDSICGTWEVLADVIYNGGIKQFRKDCPTYREVGKFKSEWADRVGLYIDLDNNESQSFNSLVVALRQRLKIA